MFPAKLVWEASCCSNRTLVCSCNRSEEHTSELQSHSDLVCRLLLEKKKKYVHRNHKLRATRLRTNARTTRWLSASLIHMQEYCFHGDRDIHRVNTLRLRRQHWQLCT